MFNNWYRNYGKRIFDLIMVVLTIIMLAPVLALIALLVRLNLGKPILFRQQRPGLDGQPFIIFKLRSMTNACDSQGKLLPDGDRLTPFGRLVRSTSLDELPALINILKGEMSLVGPRPLLMKYLNRYSAEQMRRHEIRPGLTGWAQVNGRNNLSWEKRLALDIWYVDNVSFSLDLKILFMTVWKVLRREDISQTGHATMEEFKGNLLDSERSQSLTNTQKMNTAHRTKESWAPLEQLAFSPEFKANLVVDVLSGVKNVKQACQEFKLDPYTLAIWHGEFLENMKKVFINDAPFPCENKLFVELEKLK